MVKRIRVPSKMTLDPELKDKATEHNINLSRSMDELLSAIFHDEKITIEIDGQQVEYELKRTTPAREKPEVFKVPIDKRNLKLAEKLGVNLDRTVNNMMFAVLHETSATVIEIDDKYLCVDLSFGPVTMHKLKNQTTLFPSAQLTDEDIEKSFDTIFPRDMLERAITPTPAENPVYFG